MGARKRVLKRTESPRKRNRLRGLVLSALLGWMVLAGLLWVPGGALGHDYTFGSENVVKGYTVSNGNRNAEDGSYESLAEADQYADTNFSGTTESVTTGTAGGGAFSGSLDTDDASRRTYTEADTKSADWTQFLNPTSDAQNQWDNPASPTTHWDRLDDAGTNDLGDSTTTEIYTATNSDMDRYNMADMTTPSSGYNIDVTLYCVNKKASGGGANIQAGIRIGTTDYQGITRAPTTSYVNTSSSTWTVNPATTNEWTYTEVNALITYLTTSDASPNPYCTKLVLKVAVTFTSQYKLDATLTYSSVTSTSQTTGYRVLCQGYRNGDTESCKVQVWNYITSGWIDKATVSAGSDTDYDFDLTSQERDGTNNEVKFRLIDASNGDATQTVLYLDVLKVMRKELGFALDIDMTATGCPAYGDLGIRIKGYTTAETFNIQMWDWGGSSWSGAIISVTALSNTWYTYDFAEATYLSSGQVKIRFTDGTAAASDTTQDIMYLDVAWVTHYHVDPTLTVDGCNGPKNLGATVDFWVIYTDADNDAPSYVKVNIGGTDYTMIENITDTQYTDGKAYYYQKSDIPGGSTNYYFKAKDANSGEVTTGVKQVVVNRLPSLSQDGITPATGNAGDTFTFYVIYTDADNNAPSYIRVNYDTVDYDMDANDSDSDYTDGKAYHYHKALAGGSHTYYFKTADYLSGLVSSGSKGVDVNNIPVLSGFARDPAGTFYITTTLNFTVTFTDADGDLPSSIKWREGVIQNQTMLESDSLDLDTTDGKVYYYTTQLGHGTHSYDYWASDGMKGTSGGSNTATPANRDPDISTYPTDPTSKRNIYWEYQYQITELDGDPVIWEKSTNASFLTLSGAGLLYGTTSDPVAWYEITVYANDSYGGAATPRHTHLTVYNQVPVISSSGNTTQGHGTFMSYEIQASDADADTLAYDLWTDAPFLSLDGHWVNGTVDEGAWECSVWANDSYGGSDEEHWHLAVEAPAVNQPPYFTSTPVYEGHNGTDYAYDANASDSDPDVLWYELESNATFLGISHITGMVTGHCSLLGSYWVNISVWDTNLTGGNLSASQNYTLTVLNDQPTIISSPVLTGAVMSLYWYDAEAIDVNGDTLVWSTDDKPVWLVLDPDTGNLSGIPVIAGDYLVRLLVWDGITYDWQNFTITVSDIYVPPPPPPPPPPSPFELGMVLGLSLIFMFLVLKQLHKVKGATKKTRK